MCIEEKREGISGSFGGIIKVGTANDMNGVRRTSNGSHETKVSLLQFTFVLNLNICASIIYVSLYRLHSVECFTPNLQACWITIYLFTPSTNFFTIVYCVLISCSITSYHDNKVIEYGISFCKKAFALFKFKIKTMRILQKYNFTGKIFIYNTIHISCS